MRESPTRITAAAARLADAVMATLAEFGAALTCHLAGPAAVSREQAERARVSRP